MILVFDTSEDRDKFVILYETYGKTIYYTLSRYNFDEHTKEDLSQDIYIILAVHLDNIDITNHKKTTSLRLHAITVKIICATRTGTRKIFWMKFQNHRQMKMGYWIILSPRIGTTG